SESDGLAGKKEASIKDLYFHLVSDSTTRIAGLQTGEYDFVFRVPFDNYDQINDDPNLDTLLHPSSNGFLGFNKAEGPATDFKLREVINTALDNNEVMLAGFPMDEFYWLDSGYMDKDMVNWASTAGHEYYNQN